MPGKITGFFKTVQRTDVYRNPNLPKELAPMSKTSNKPWKMSSSPKTPKPAGENKRKKEEGPKKALTTYLLFSMEMRASEEFKKEADGKTFVETTKLLAAKWKLIDAATKEKFEKAALADKERYKTECAAAGIEIKQPAAKKPKQPKSALAIFKAQKLENDKEFAASCDGKEAKEIQKLATTLFKALSEDDRKVFETEASTDKTRFETEMNAAGIPLPEKKAPKTPREPVEGTASKKRKASGEKEKKGRSAYIMFCAATRLKLKVSEPDLKQTEIMQKMGAMWKAIGEEEKKVYEAQAAQDKLDAAAANVAAKAEKAEKAAKAGEQLLVEWVAKGVALGSALDEMLNGSSVAVSFAEFAAHDVDTLKAGLDGMKEALAEDGANAGLTLMTQFIAALLAHKTTPVQPPAPTKKPAPKRKRTAGKPKAAKKTAAPKTPAAKPVSAKEKLLAEWVAKGVALGSSLDQMLNGQSVAVSFAEFAAHDTATLASGKEGMEAALAEDGANAGLALMVQFVTALLEHQTAAEFKAMMSPAPVPAAEDVWPATSPVEGPAETATVPAPTPAAESDSSSSSSSSGATAPKKEDWMAAWVRKGEARVEALTPFLNDKSVAETFAEFAAYDDETLRGGKEGMQDAIKQGEADNTDTAGLEFFVQFLEAVIAHQPKEKAEAEAAEEEEVSMTQAEPEHVAVSMTQSDAVSMTQDTPAAEGAEATATEKYKELPQKFRHYVTKAEAIEGIEEVLQSGVENNLLELVNMGAAEITDGIGSFGSMLKDGTAPNAEAFELILAFMHEVKAQREQGGGETEDEGETVSTKVDEIEGIRDL